MKKIQFLLESFRPDTGRKIGSSTLRRISSLFADTILAEFFRYARDLEINPLSRDPIIEESNRLKWERNEVFRSTGGRANWLFDTRWNGDGSRCGRLHLGWR